MFTETLLIPVDTTPNSVIIIADISDRTSQLIHTSVTRKLRQAAGGVTATASARYIVVAIHCAVVM